MTSRSVALAEQRLQDRLVRNATLIGWLVCAAGVVAGASTAAGTVSPSGKLVFTDRKDRIGVVVPGKPRRLFGGLGSDPVWSPDRRTVAFSWWVPHRDEVLGCLVGRRRRTRATPADDASADVYRSKSTWAPDGRSIAFARECYDADQNLSADLYAVEIRTGMVRPLTSTPSSWEEMPAWSPDGRELVFLQGSGARTGLTALNLKTHRIRRITPSNSDSDPAWSPDGSQLTFTRDKGTGGANAVFSVRTDGSGLRRVTDWGRFYSPVWSPDRHSIAVTLTDRPTDPNTTFSIRIVDAATGRTQWQLAMPAAPIGAEAPAARLPREG